MQDMGSAGHGKTAKCLDGIRDLTTNIVQEIECRTWEVQDMGRPLNVLTGYGI